MAPWAASAQKHKYKCKIIYDGYLDLQHKYKIVSLCVHSHYVFAAVVSLVLEALEYW